MNPTAASSRKPGTSTDPLERLNPAQREAATHFEGPILVLAGAGSGKTRVLTTRIARLIEEHGVDPRHILAVTFTNKAAGEMRERVSRLLGAEPAGMWAGTFHAIGARILRHEARYAGRSASFTIYDEEDSLAATKRAMERLKISTKQYSPKAIRAAISDAKNSLVSVREYTSLAMDPLSRAAAQVYAELERVLREGNAADFDDLLVLPVRIFQENPDRLAAYRERFKFILVDEYQDTNRAQYQLIKLLGGEHGNVLVVGDDDQCLVRGTRVKMGDGSRRVIEDVRVGDLVMSGVGSGRFRPAAVLRVHRSRRNGEGIAITTRSGRRLVSTPEHTHFAGYILGIVPQVYFTYLMYKRGIGYRLGTTQVYTRGQKRPVPGFMQRMAQEHGDALWIVGTHQSENDARAEEYILSLRYRIPTLPFTPRIGAPRGDGKPAAGLVHDPSFLRRVFSEFDTETSALELLADRGLSRAFPHYRPRSRNSNRRNVVMTLCGDRRGARPMHRIAIAGNDAAGRAALERLELSVRPAGRGSRGWRHETARASYAELERAVSRIGAEFEVNVVRMARLGNGCAAERDTNSLPFIPAASVQPGMAMFDEHGDFDIVTSVERVPLDDDVFDLDVEDTHNFIAEGIVTHNSIYGWRGADIRNILDFEKDFPEAKVVRLEENYRSTPQVLDLANVVISANKSRRGKTLRATREGGEKVVVVACADERDEGDYVSGEILDRRRLPGGAALRDFAILYRTNSQSRAMEEALRKRGIPYRIVGAVRFYDRREIRDLMAYLKLIANPADDEAFRRAVGVPRRGLGDTTIDRLAESAREAGVPLLAAASRADLLEELRPNARNALIGFATLIRRYRERAADTSVDELLRDLVEEIRFAEYIKRDGPDGPDRLENVRELITSAAETVVDEGGELGLTPLDAFLQRTSLVTGLDKLDPDADAVTMMTLHNAKGLEFPVVFITGLEEGLFPLSRSHDDPELLEEERRLFYVGITRAERRLYLSHARSRRRNGEEMTCMPSSFLRPIPDEMLEQRATARLRGSASMSWLGTASPSFGAHSSGFGSTAASRRSGTPVRRSAAWDPDVDASQDAPAFVAGERVKHPRFGAGSIVEVGGTGRDAKVTVDFDDESVGRKRLVIAYAGLERGWD